MVPVLARSVGMCGPTRDRSIQAVLHAWMTTSGTTWHHVAAVFDNGTATIYIDGYHEPPVTGGSTFGTGNTRFGYVGVGSESTTFNADPRTPASFFAGDVDDVRIYQRALSAAEVAGMAGRTQAFDEP